MDRPKSKHGERFCKVKVIIKTWTEVESVIEYDTCCEQFIIPNIIVLLLKWQKKITLIKNKVMRLLKAYIKYYIVACGTIVKKLPFTIDIEEGKEAAKFNPIIGKLYWPSDGSEADGPGIRDIPNYKNKDKVK